ncbi:MAG: M28 family peptidase [Candidatus Kapaibacterium sp.]
MKRYDKILVGIIASLLIILQSVNSASQPAPDSDRIHEAVKYLASDELKGRLPGTEGGDKAADFIVNHFKTSGLKSWNNSFKQEFMISTGYKYGESSSVAFETIVQRPGVPADKLPKVRQNWVLSHDFVPLGISENGKVEGELAFVGFGISAPEIGYDDYEGIDVKDKIVVLISESPDLDKKDGEFAPYSSLRYKASNARNKGAIGIIMVRIQGDSMNVFERPEFENRGKNTGIVAVQAWRQSLSKFFPKNKTLIAAENNIVKNRKPESFILPNVRVYINSELIDVESPTHNVIGYVEGSDPILKDEYIVIGAHYDHLGYGGPTSLNRSGGKPQIHHGADDNASGVSALIELAYAIAKNPLKRSVIFSSFSAEEMGLLGSAHFIDNSPVDLSKIVAMINMDMVGRMKKNELTTFGTSSGSYFDNIIDSLDLIDTLSIIKASDAYGPSDHASFVVKDIPVLMFFTGVHEDYHKPSDKADKINYGGIVWSVSFIHRVAETIGNYHARPIFTKTESHSKSMKSEREHSYGEVWFGIIPDFGEHPLGCKISGATPGSPADKAGMKADDIITKIDDAEIKNLYDFMYKVRAHKAGDTLNVHILRGKEHTEKIELKVTLVSKVK